MRAITIAGFLLCLAMAVTLEVLARREANRIAPLATLLDRVMATRSARIGILLFWWWLGWHFLVGQTV
ncbi:MAG: hypothetical protein JWO18_2299 [Microbacteriaceae bacterium]|jgi:hypothetical protein|nr:hypothetical protein [Microbacteriaceae bacterium]